MFALSRKTLYLFFVPVACLVAQNRTTSLVEHVGFNSPEGWALKYYASATLFSGLQPPEPLVEGRQIGSVTFGLEMGWLPTLSADRARVGFSGRKEEDLNKTPIFLRPVVRLGLPWRFTAVVAGPPPIQVFGITPRLFAFGLERPLLERNRWRLGWRGYGQVGSLKGAFTCPNRALAFPAGSPQNPSGCVAESSDIASLRYAGTEIQFAYHIPRMPKLSPHLAGGVNYIDGIFQVDAPLATRLDRTRLWTRGMTYSGTAGVSYLLTQRVALTVDAFYSPLWVRRVATGPRAIDGLFNVRALVSYSFR
jgi:hypothetical protein